LIGHQCCDFALGDISFADECVAVLVEQQGEAWFRDHVALIHHDAFVRRAILEAVQHRLSAPQRAA